MAKAKKTWNISEFFVGEARKQQAEIMTHVQDTWSNWDVAVIEMPVATGKSKFAEAVARAAASARTSYSSNGAVIVPNNNLLVEQYLSGVTGFQSLHKKDSYWCKEFNRSCGSRADETGVYCRARSGNPYHPGSCAYTRDLRAARSEGKLIVNQHIYMAHKLYRDVVIFDEAHTLLHTLQDMSAKNFWRHDWGWRRTFDTAVDVLDWIQNDVPQADLTEDLELLRDVLTGTRPGYSVFVGEDEYRGVDKELVRLIPLDVRSAPPILWPEGKVQKLILMSATINELDVEALGLDERRVAYFRTDSPIPIDRRPAVVYPTADFSYAHRTDEMDLLVRRLEEEILPEHEHERGLIHAPYSVARALQDRLTDRRFVFHTREDKKDVVKKFLAGGYGEDSVLVGSGMHEGLDLAEDKARFQVITTTPRRSIGDPGLAWLAENNPRQYEWLTIRDLAQAYGRVCRGPSDYGTTIITDKSVTRELASDQLPSWFKEALTYIT